MAIRQKYVHPAAFITPRQSALLKSSLVRFTRALRSVHIPSIHAHIPCDKILACLYRRLSERSRANCSSASFGRRVHGQVRTRGDSRTTDPFAARSRTRGWTQLIRLGCRSDDRPRFPRAGSQLHHQTEGHSHLTTMVRTHLQSWRVPK